MPYKDKEVKLAYDRQYKEARKLRGYCQCGKKKEDRRRKWCYSCKPLYDKYLSDSQYRQNNRSKVNSYARKYNRQIRHEAIMAYGGYVCACCGDTTKEFMALDHINGGGNQHRKNVGHKNIYSWLKKNGYPTGFRVLCHNCNMSRGFYGYCPHELSDVNEGIGTQATVCSNSLYDQGDLIAVAVA